MNGRPGQSRESARGFVAAGGRSSRMGRDKAWLELGGAPLIEHVIKALEPAVADVAILANDPRYASLGRPVYGDERRGIGPLEALRVALAHCEPPWALLVACDLPFVTTELFNFLLAARADAAAVVPLDGDGRWQPLCALYRKSLLSHVEALIEEGERMMRRLFALAPPRLVAFDELRHLPGAREFFINVNTPDEYRDARKRRKLIC